MTGAALDTQPGGRLANRDLLRLLWPLFRPRLGHFAGALLLLLVSLGGTLAGPALFGHAIDVDIRGGDLAGLRRTALWYLAIQVGQIITTYLLRNWLEWIGQQMLAELRRGLMAHLLRLPLAFYDRTTPGQLLTRVESDTQALRVLFTNTAVMLLRDVLLFVGMFAVMLWASWRLALVVFGILPVMLAVTLYFQRRLHPVFVEVRRQGAEVAGRLAEFIQAMPVLQAFARRQWAVADFQELNRRKYRTNLQGEGLVITWFNSVLSLQTIALALILGLGGYWAMVGLVSIGTLVMFRGYVVQFFQPLMRLSEELAAIQKALAATERIGRLLGEPLVVDDPSEPLPWPGRGARVEFQNVWFRYEGPAPADGARPFDTSVADEVPSEDHGGGLLLDDPPLAPFYEAHAAALDAERRLVPAAAADGAPPRPVDADAAGPAAEDDGWILRDVSFTVPAGQTCALVGPTGSGKTTIINLLLRFYDPQRGRILIDGVDLRHLKADDLRQRVGMVPQDIYLFPGDLADNLRLGRDCTPAELEAAARATLADRFIARLPGGMHAELYERGANLSVGQRQLLSFTRAVVRMPELLVLDEATSAVDPATEALLGEATRRTLAGRTALVIAHRLATIRHSDQILVLQRGRIVERGTHQALLAVDGLYRSLSHLQHGEERHVG